MLHSNEPMIKHKVGLLNPAEELGNVLFENCSAFTHVTACTLANSPSDPLHRRRQPLRYLHDCSDCYRLER